MRLHADRVDHGIHADPAGHFHQGFAHIGLAEVDDLRAQLLRQCETVRIVVDRNHPGCAHHDGRLDREQSDRAAAPHRNRIVGLDVGIFRRHPAGREDVRKEQHLVVFQMVGNDDRADIGKGHAGVFGLSARVAAGQVRIAEQRGHRLAVERRRHILLFSRVGIVAGRILLLLAMETAAAADRERHDDALPFLQIARRPRLDDFAHEFMAQHIARRHAGNDAIIQVKVGPADGRAGDLDDRIAGIDNFRIADRVHANVVGSMPGKCSHHPFSCLAARVSSRVRADVAISPVSMSILKRFRSCRA